MGGHVIQTWSISIVHLLDHSDWFRVDHVIQVGPVILNPKSSSELWKRSSLLQLLSSAGWKAQTNRAQHIKWASRRMKPVQRKMEPDDGETWVLMTMCPWIKLCLKLVYPLDFSVMWINKYPSLLKLLWVGFLLLETESKYTCLPISESLSIKLEVKATLILLSSPEDRVEQELTYLSFYRCIKITW